MKRTPCFLPVLSFLSSSSFRISTATMLLLLPLLSLLLFLVCPISSSTPENDLLCFQCKDSSLDECRKMKYLQPCPNDQAYDTCETVISKKADDANATVTKSCVLGPCFLDDETGSGLGLSAGASCDTSRNSFQCVSCCREKACNGASTRHATMTMLMFSIAAVWW